jgi:hypothetical protein
VRCKEPKPRANDRRHQATSGHVQPRSVRPDGTPGHAQRPPGPRGNPPYERGVTGSTPAASTEVRCMFRICGRFATAPGRDPMGCVRHREERPEENRDATVVCPLSPSGQHDGSGRRPALTSAPVPRKPVTMPQPSRRRLMDSAAPAANGKRCRTRPRHAARPSETSARGQGIHSARRHG